MTENIYPCEGGCSCGEIRYRLNKEPLIVHACHCTWCQRQTGGPHVLNALYEAHEVEMIAGEVEKILTASPSGAGQLIARCPTCKVAVWSNYLKGGWKERCRFVRVGTLDNAALIPPDVHIYTTAKLPWYVIPEGHLSSDEFYDKSVVWNEKAQKRAREFLAPIPSES